MPLARGAAHPPADAAAAATGVFRCLLLRVAPRPAPPRIRGGCHRRSFLCLLCVALRPPLCQLSRQSPQAILLPPLARGVAPPPPMSPQQLPPAFFLLPVARGAAPLPPPVTAAVATGVFAFAGCARRHAPLPPVAAVIFVATARVWRRAPPRRRRGRCNRRFSLLTVACGAATLPPPIAAAAAASAFSAAACSWCHAFPPRVAAAAASGIRFVSRLRTAWRCGPPRNSDGYRQCCSCFLLRAAPRPAAPSPRRLPPAFLLLPVVRGAFLLRLRHPGCCCWSFAAAFRPRFPAVVPRICFPAPVLTPASLLALATPSLPHRCAPSMLIARVIHWAWHRVASL